MGAGKGGTPGYVGLVFLACYSALIQPFLTRQALYQTLQVGLYAITLALLGYLLLTGRLRGVPRFLWVCTILAMTSVAMESAASIFCQSAFSPSLVLVIPIIMMLIGVGVPLDYSRIRILGFVYGFSSACAAWYVNLLYNPALSVEGQYFFAGKNQIGVVVGAAIAVLLYIFVMELRLGSRLGRLAIIAGLIAANLLPLLLIRNRSTILGVALLLVLTFGRILLSKQSHLGARLLVAVGVAVLAANYRPIVEFVYEALFSNYDVGSLDSISANRWPVYLQSLDLIRNNLLVGAPDSIQANFVPHNFVIYSLLAGGVVLGFPHLVVYFFVLYRLVHEWGQRLAVPEPWAFPMVISYVCSLLEYTHPFGPGTTQIMAWCLLGASLQTRVREHYQRSQK